MSDTIETVANEHVAQMKKASPKEVAQMMAELADVSTSGLRKMLKAMTLAFGPFPEPDQVLSQSILVHVILKRNDEVSAEFRKSINAVESALSDFMPDGKCNCPACTAKRKSKH